MYGMRENGDERLLKIGEKIGRVGKFSSKISVPKTMLNFWKNMLNKETPPIQIYFDLFIKNEIKLTRWVRKGLQIKKKKV